MVRAVLCCKEFVRGEHISTMVCLLNRSPSLGIDNSKESEIVYFHRILCYFNIL